ncbi:hypothetical protein PC116_g26481 [Phytophthora cactorum]|uniref:Uncharacterized protein n=2 Tax=Phytophthora cactorum TaxID=29920 RepID=A0A8T0Y5S4_9STRA|nr:hypothetical protein PC113_g22069 [Phytophthora cactorum]KAG2968480.1 hypothetical protein PC119_g24198 [Phytophthora cactorum]KAG3126266.1 hypothetical protein C6341_g25434 [Phytophthora cactorum]KAG4225077.1 hypothetical protein PC116_g26481 [Phytophthora cactorum]
MWSRLNQNATEKTKLSVLEAENRELKNARPQALASSKDSAVAFDPSWELLELKRKRHDAHVKEAEAARTAWKKEKEELLVQMEQLRRRIGQLEEQDKKASSCISKLQQALDAEQLAASHNKILLSDDFQQTIDHFTEDHTIDYEHMTRVLWRQYVVDQAKSFKNSP